MNGIHETFGSYWNKTRGRYQVFVTDPLNSVELRLGNGSRVIISTDNPTAFLAAVRKAALEHNRTIDVNGG